jgi:hypothetical protein
VREGLARWGLDAPQIDSCMGSREQAKGR